MDETLYRGARPPSPPLSLLGGMMDGMTSTRAKQQRLIIDTMRRSFDANPLDDEDRATLDRELPGEVGAIVAAAADLAVQQARRSPSETWRDVHAHADALSEHLCDRLAEADQQAERAAGIPSPTEAADIADAVRRRGKVRATARAGHESSTGGAVDLDYGSA
jgi:hypothetical protein